MIIDLYKLENNPKIKIDDNHDWGRQYQFTNTRRYCNKWLELDQPMVKGSFHKHRHKYETWKLLVGMVHVKLVGEHRIMEVGDELHIRVGIPHQFWAEVPSLISETSTHDDDDDTFRWNEVEKNFINDKGEIYFNLVR